MPAGGDTARVFRIGSFSIDLAARSLTFEGDAVEVQPKVFDLIAYLLRHRERVVSKEELFDEVWPQVIVTEASLSQTIKRARDLFRQRGFDEDLIRTVSRRGYQFNGKLLTSDSSARNLDSGTDDGPDDADDNGRSLIQALVDADHASLEAMAEFQDVSPHGLVHAEQLLHQALREAPDRGPLLARLSDVIRRQGSTGLKEREEAFRQALLLAQQSVRSSPDDGVALLQLAELQHRHFWDFAGAAATFEAALLTMPDSVELQTAYSRFLAKCGDDERAAEIAATALALRPDSPRALSNHVLRLIKAGRLDAARKSLDKLVDQGPDHTDLPWLEANWYLRGEHYREALRWIGLEELTHLRRSLSAIIFFHLGRKNQAQSLLHELMADDADGAAFQIAEVHGQWGDADGAFQWLERALSNGDPGLAELYSSLLLEDLYADERFPALAERIGLPPRTAAH